MKEMEMVFKLSLFTIFLSISSCFDLCASNSSADTHNKIEKTDLNNVTVDNFLAYRSEKAAHGGRCAGICTGLFLIGIKPALKGQTIAPFSSSFYLISVSLIGLLGGAVSSRINKNKVIDAYVELWLSKDQEKISNDQKQIIQIPPIKAFFEGFCSGVGTVLLPYVAYNIDQVRL